MKLGPDAVFQPTAAFVEQAAQTTARMKSSPSAQAGSWDSFIPQTSAISIKAAWHSKVEAQFIFAVNETFYKRIFFLGIIFESGKTNGKWIFKKNKKQKTKKLLPGLVIDLLRILWASVSFPDCCRFLSHSKFSLLGAGGGTWKYLFVLLGFSSLISTRELSRISCQGVPSTFSFPSKIKVSYKEGCQMVSNRN